MYVLLHDWNQGRAGKTAEAAEEHDTKLPSVIDLLRVAGRAVSSYVHMLQSSESSDRLRSSTGHFVLFGKNFQGNGNNLLPTDISQSLFSKRMTTF